MGLQHGPWVLPQTPLSDLILLILIVYGIILTREHARDAWVWFCVVATSVLFCVSTMRSADNIRKYRRVLSDVWGTQYGPSVYKGGQGDGLGNVPRRTQEG